jgi:metal-responsive CopG/Arc/MetJ family transcriptional regulator
MQKQNVVVRLPNRMLRKLEAFEKREDLPDRTTSITWLLWKGLRDYEKKEKVALGGKKAGKQDSKKV